jgi:hypothetical protein
VASCAGLIVLQSGVNQAGVLRLRGPARAVFQGARRAASLRMTAERVRGVERKAGPSAAKGAGFGMTGAADGVREARRGLAQHAAPLRGREGRRMPIGRFIPLNRRDGAE